MRKQLPHLIKKGMTNEALIKAIRENFEALAGGIEWTVNYLDINGVAGTRNLETMRSIAHDATNANVDAILNEEGVGRADGEAPTAAPTGLTVTPGINYDLWVTWSAIKNNSPVTYHVERKIGAGGVYAEVGETVAVPGHDAGSWQFHDTGLALDTDYFYRVRAEDGDGLGPYSTESGPHRVNKTVNEQIADATINLATKVQGLLPNTNLATISDPAKLADAIVSNAKIAAGTIDASSKVAAGTIVGNLIAAGVVAATHLAAGSVVAGKIAADAIVASNIQSGQIQTGHMVADSIHGDRVSAGTLSAAKIVSASITSTQIAASSITADRLSVNELSAVSANLGTVTSGSIYSTLFSTGTDAFDTALHIHMKSSASGVSRSKDGIQWVKWDGMNARYNVYALLHKEDGGKMRLNSGPEGLSLLYPFAEEVVIGVGNSNLNRLALRKTAGGGGTATNDHVVFFFRGDLSPQELRVVFPNGTVRTLATS